jgi:hypothetical protein
MVNLFPEVIPEGGKELGFLNRAPGLRLLGTVGTGPIRGMWQFGGFAYIVSGTQLYKVTSSWVSTPLGAITGTGPVSMSDNGIQLFVAANPDGFIYNTNTGVYAKITDPDFPGAVAVGYIDGYFVFNQPNSQQVWVTSLLDGTQVDALEFQSAEGSPDNLVSLIVDHREVWLFGTNSVEVWFDSGATDYPLQRIQGAFNEIGCIAPYSVAKLDNGLFWLGGDTRGRGIVYRANGYTGQRISTHAVEWQIQQYADISDAVAYTYQQDGHAFYVLNFPTANITWVYDVSTNAWHERAGLIDGNFTRHRGNCQMTFDNEVCVGDYQDGRIYAFDLNVYRDDDVVQKWLRSWRALPTGANKLVRTAHHSLQLDCEAGTEFPFEEQALLLCEDGNFLITEDGRYILIAGNDEEEEPGPKVMLRWSDDGGHTWSNEHWRSTGGTGQYFKRVIWRRLGMTLKLRDRVYEVSGADAVKIAIMGAELHIGATNA